MLLAGGEGRRLGALTSNLAKPAVPFGGKYRIIDFTLSNCTNSGIETVGVLTQYQPHALHQHVATGEAWKLNHPEGGVALLSPPSGRGGISPYTGTANAVYQNMKFMEKYNPEYVLIISGDHIYNMDYNKMLKFHKEKNADVTISVIEVDWAEASRFGIMSTGDDNRITRFAEKPAKPESNLASMGIYIFSWKALKECLEEDERNPESSHDFGKDVIPCLLRKGSQLYAYPFQGYWKDVGTIESLWEAHMDLLDESPEFEINEEEWPVYTNIAQTAPQYVAPSASITRSLVSEGCTVYGRVHHSVLFHGAEVAKGSVIKDSIIMPNVKIGSNVAIYNAIIGEGSVIREGSVIGNPDANEITVIGDHEVVYREGEKMPKIFLQRSKLALEKIG